MATWISSLMVGAINLVVGRLFLVVTYVITFAPSGTSPKASTLVNVNSNLTHVVLGMTLKMATATPVGITAAQ